MDGEWIGSVSVLKNHYFLINHKRSPGDAPKHLKLGGMNVMLNFMRFFVVTRNVLIWFLLLICFHGVTVMLSGRQISVEEKAPVKRRKRGALCPSCIRNSHAWTESIKEIGKISEISQSVYWVDCPSTLQKSSEHFFLSLCSISQRIKCGKLLLLYVS